MYGCPNPANILIVLTLVFFRRWEVASRSAFGTRRGDKMILRGTSGAMLACLGVPACVFRPAALLQRGHVRAVRQGPSHHRHPRRPHRSTQDTTSNVAGAACTAITPSSSKLPPYSPLPALPNCRRCRQYKQCSLAQQPLHLTTTASLRWYSRGEALAFRFWDSLHPTSPLSVLCGVSTYCFQCAFHTFSFYINLKLFSVHLHTFPSR